jgi:anti-sigma B factor antagonist
MALTVNVVDNNGIKIFRCIGYIDSETSGQVKTVLEEALNSKNYRIIIDLEKVDYVSSAGWGLFVGYLHDARKNKGDIKICCMKKEVLEIFELLDFTNIFQYHASVETAIKAF